MKRSIETKAYGYNHARQELERAQEITRAEAIEIIAGTEKVELHLHLTESDIADANVRERGAYPYNSDVADELLKILGVENTASAKDRAETIVYGSSCYRRAQDRIRLYEEMQSEGYLSLHDITPDMDGKKAILKGKTDHDWMSRKHDDEKIVLVNHGSVYGYRSPRMRTRYYQPQVDADLFIKII